MLRRFAPIVHQLEERRLPATFVVTQLTDGLERGTLRWAVNQADQSPGHNIVVLRSGTYTLGGNGQTQALQVSGHVLIKGAGSGATRVDATALGDRAFDVLSGDVKLQGLTISGGHATMGGAILIQSGKVDITKCVFSANVAAGVDGSDGDGGAIYLTAGSLRVATSSFNGNQAVGSPSVAGSGRAAGFGVGGALYLNDQTTANLYKDNFTANSAMGAPSSTRVYDTGGTAIGGAISVNFAKLTMVGGLIAGNQAVGAAGADADLATGGGTATGGAISSRYDSIVSLSKVTLSGNQALGGNGGNGASDGPGGVAQGGAIYSAFGGSLKAADVQITQNAAIGGNAGNGTTQPVNPNLQSGGLSYGGAIYLFIGSSATLTNATIVGNTAQGGNGGNGAYGTNAGPGAGGAIWSASGSGSNQFVRIDKSVISANQAVGGQAGIGTVSSGSAGSATGGAGAFGSLVTLNVNNSRLNQNRAIGVTYAAGGAIQTLSTTVGLSNDSFRQNVAQGGPAAFGAGGAVYVSGASILTGNALQFSGNQAIGGDGVGSYSAAAGQAGAIFSLSSTMTLRNAKFVGDIARGGNASTGNAGTGVGGAVQVINGSASLINTMFDSNQAIAESSSDGTATGGALAANPASALIIRRARIFRNKAIGQTGYGGGIYLAGGGGAVISGVTYSQNSASTSGPDIFVQP
jgi:hypothetical protein